MTAHGERDTCLHCQEPITCHVLREFVAGGGDRPVPIWAHDASGHERCAGRVTLAEPAEHPPD